MRNPLKARRSVLALTLSVAVGLGVAMGTGPVSPASATTYTTPQAVPGAPAHPRDGIVYDGLLYLTALDDGGTRRLYSFDGTTFTLVSAEYSDPTNFVILGDTLFFSALNSSSTNYLVYLRNGEITPSVVNSVYGALEIVELPGTGSAIVSMPFGIDQTALVLLNAAGGTAIEVFKYIRDLTVYGDTVYFTGIAVGQSDYQMFSTDGLSAVLARPGAGNDMTVWNDMMYMVFIVQDYAFYQLTDLTLGPAVIPPLFYAGRFTPAPAGLFFTADNPDTGDSQVLYLWDGTNATQSAGSPYRVSNITPFGNDVFMTGDFDGTLKACSLDVSAQCFGDFQQVIVYDGSTFTTISPASADAASLMAYNNRLYFDEGNQWMFVEVQPELPNTGVDASPAMSTGTLTLLLGVAVSVVVVAIRRRKSATANG